MTQSSTYTLEQFVSRDTHVIRGRAWSGAGAIAQVEVSLDGGQT
jgi:Mo-co oxidoreductase dimerisation domain